MNEQAQRGLAVYNTAVEICKKLRDFEHSRDYLEMLNPGENALHDQLDEYDERLRQFAHDVGQTIAQHAADDGFRMIGGEE